jgi:AsmA protein
MAGRKMAWTRPLLAVVAAIALVLVSAAVGAALWLSRSSVSAELEQTLSHNLGRQVRIEKGVHLAVWPVLGVRADGLSIANIDGGQAAHLLEAQSVDVGLSPLPLLSGRLEFRKVALNGAVIHFEKLADGRVNWNLSNRPPPKAGEKPPEWLKDLRVDDLLVRRSTVSFYDGRSRLTQAIGDINMSLKLTGLDHPATLKGRFSWAGQTANLDLTADDPRALLNGGRSHLALTFSSKPLNLKIAGIAGIAPGPIDGDIDLSGPSVRDLARLTGKPMKPGPGLGAFAVTGHLTKDGPVIGFDHARLRLDHLDAAGDLSIDTTNARPFVRGDLRTANLDMNPYLGPEPPPARAWPTTPIGLESLHAFDADLNLAADHVQFRKIVISQARLRVRLQDGAADIGIDQMSLYGGVGTGGLRVADQAGVGGYGFRFQLRGVQAKTLLSDLAKIDRVQGSATAVVALAAQGRNVDQIMHSLSGKASLTVNDGAVVGADLGALSSNLTSALSGGAVGPNARTAFTVAGADFTLVHGVAATKNLTISGVGVSVSGIGSVDLGGRATDMLIKPQGSAGFGGHKINLGAVPFRVHGPWVKLSYEPDLSGAAQALLARQAESLIGAGGKSDASGFGGLLQGLTGGRGSEPANDGNGQAQDGSQPASRPRPQSSALGDLLNGLAPH